MTPDQIINLLVAVTLIEMMAAVGLGVTFAELRHVSADWRLVTGAVLANYVCVPAAAVGLLLLVGPTPEVAAGFLILAVCPGAPFGPPCTKLAGGDVTVAVGAMVLLAASSALLAPLLLAVLLPWMLGSGAAGADPVRIVVSLFVTQLLPLAVGLCVRHWLPGLAARLQKPANLLSAVLSLVTFGVILFVHGYVLADIRWLGYLGMLALLAASLGAGWLLGGPGNASRKAMSLTTSLRNVGVGLVIATAAFPQTQAAAAIVAYGILEIVGSLLVALRWGRTVFV